MKVLYILAFTNKGLRQMVWKQIPVFMRSITLAIDQTHCEFPWRRAICRQKNICTELDIKNKKWDTTSTFRISVSTNIKVF